jgi:pseudouridine-5'-phosphate glycosidase
MRTSGLPLAARTDSIDELAAIATAHHTLGGGGLLVVVPVPESAALDAAAGQAALDRALAAAEREGIRGPAVTPFVLAQVADATGGEAVAANLALAANNASVAAQLAVALTETGSAT